MDEMLKMFIRDPWYRVLKIVRLAARSYSRYLTVTSMIGEGAAGS
jgi:hypothetical protein